mmetsp:Transcript_51960/g.113041  ORF Transcript_51960/g.113041 Transcript_51960/m.113041 type:complete len:291 (-) Transcript_51960:927-1799(-)
MPGADAITGLCIGINIGPGLEARTATGSMGSCRGACGSIAAAPPVAGRVEPAGVVVVGTPDAGAAAEDEDGPVPGAARKLAADMPLFFGEALEDLADLGDKDPLLLLDITRTIVGDFGVPEPTEEAPRLLLKLLRLFMLPKVASRGRLGLGGGLCQALSLAWLFCRAFEIPSSDAAAALDDDDEAAVAAACLCFFSCAAVADVVGAAAALADELYFFAEAASPAEASLFSLPSSIPKETDNFVPFGVRRPPVGERACPKASKKSDLSMTSDAKHSKKASMLCREAGSSRR